MLRRIRRSFGRVHLGIFAVMSALAWMLAVPGADNFWRPATLLAGPFAGAVDRGWQSCCTEWSMTLFTIGGPVVLLGALAQVVIKASGPRNILRYWIWAFALFIWFGLAIPSLIHAAS